MTAADRPLIEMTDQQLQNYCGDIDENAAVPGCSREVIRAGEVAVAEVNARRALKSAQDAA
jgi:hypothetical protein